MLLLFIDASLEVIVLTLWLSQNVGLNDIGLVVIPCLLLILPEVVVVLRNWTLLGRVHLLLLIGLGQRSQVLLVILAELVLLQSPVRALGLHLPTFLECILSFLFPG